jgi:hypothetical protein
MSPREEILRLAKEADAALKKPDSSGMPNIEAHCYAIVKIACECTPQRPEICAAFQRILTEPDAGAWEVLMLSMHLLRWPEMKEWFEKKHRECITANDWRGEPVYRAILDAFSDDWDDRDMYPSLAKKA